MSEISPIQENSVPNWNTQNEVSNEPEQSQEVFQQEEQSYQAPDLDDPVVQAQLKDMASYTNGVEKNHESKYANNNSEGEKYSHQKEILEANRDILMPQVLAMANASQIAEMVDNADLGADFNKEALEDALNAVASDSDFLAHCKDKNADLNDLATIALNNSGFDFSANSAIKDQFINMLPDLAQSVFDNSTKASDLPKEAVQEFFDAGGDKVEGVVDPHVYTLKTGSYDGSADGNIATGMIFAASGDNVSLSDNGKVSINMTDVTAGLSEEDAKNAIQNRIGEAFNLKDTDGNGTIALNSEAGSVIADMIARMPENSEIFAGYDFANGSVAKFTQRVYDYMQEHPDTKLAVKGVDISSIDSTKTADNLIQEGNEVRFSRLHNTIDTMPIDENAKGIDILGYMEYGNTTLKEALQNSIVANSFNSNILLNPEFQGLSYEQTLEKAKNLAQTNPDYAKVVEDLTLIEDRFSKEPNFASAIIEIRDRIEANQQNVETPEALKELAAATVRQELGNNFGASAFSEFFDQTNDSTFALLNTKITDVVKATGSNIKEVKLEDANFARKMEPIQAGSSTRTTGGGGNGSTPDIPGGDPSCDEPPEQIPPDNCDEAPEQT